MTVTRDDVARLAGVSPATVSYVINDGPRPVAEATRAKVLWAIEQLGYQPNVMAQSLRRRRTNTLGLVFTTIERHLSHPYFVDLLTSIGEECAKQGFDLLLSPCSDRAAEKRIYERLVGGQRVDGIIFTGVRHNDFRITYLKRQKIPFIMLGRPEHDNADDGIFYVDVDGAQGTDIATQHLIDLGWDRIACIGLPEELVCTDQRVAGYRRALERNGREYDESLVIYPTRSHITEDEGFHAMTKLLKRNNPPDAVIAFSDELAIGAMLAAQKQGLSVGRDIAVVGFDDIPAASFARTRLTTIRQPIYEIGSKLGEMLIRLVKGEKIENGQLILAPELIVRESCGAARSIQGYRK